MADRASEGVVIQVRDYGESDKIVTLYCPQDGKINVLAKGAKRSKKRFVNKLELFSYLSIQYNDKYKLPIITEAALLDSFIPLRQQFISYSAATLLCEHLYYWTVANDGDPELFSWLLWSLQKLSENRQPQGVLVLFLTKLYGIMGYQPNFDGCAICHNFDHRHAPYGFKTGQGIVVCQKCSREARPAIHLSIPTIKLLGKAFSLPAAKLPRLKFSSDSSYEALNMFKFYGRYLLDRDFQSWRYVL